MQFGTGRGTIVSGILKTIGITALAALASSQAFASLTTFQVYSGANYGVSTSGWGSVDSSGQIATSIPSGATLVSAYLYSAYYGGITPTATLNGSDVNFTQNNPNATACCSLGSSRADVTSIVAAAYATAGSPTTAFNIGITEGLTDNQDGEELVTVYQYATGANRTVALLDGFASVTGDTATLTLGSPVDGSTAAQLMIGDNFSCCDQASSINVNGQVMTTVAGNNDDCVSGFVQNGCLITVGTNLNDGGAGSDPFTPASPTYAQDHERHDLTPYLTVGDTAITITTANASENDNIFSAVFVVSGDATVSDGTAPEPGTWFMLATGLAGLGVAKLRRR